MFTKKTMPILMVFIAIICLSFTACTYPTYTLTETSEINDHANNIDENQKNNTENDVGNDIQSDIEGATESDIEGDTESDIENEIDDEYKNPAWITSDYYILTYYPNGFNGAPYGCNYGQDTTGTMSISEMLASLDEIGGGFIFDLEMVQGLCVEFSFTPHKTPAEIKDVYYINGNDATERHYLDDFIKIPEEIGVYNFFVSLEWDDGAEETVFFRAKVAESFHQLCM
jgi:hypothetical protein